MVLLFCYVAVLRCCCVVLVCYGVASVAIVVLLSLALIPYGADYVCGGELFTHLHQVGPFTEDQTKVYAAEVTLALEHLHHVSMWVWSISGCGQLAEIYTCIVSMWVWPMCGCGQLAEVMS